MANTKTKIVEFLLFAFLALFPLGLILSVNFGNGLRLNPIDLLVLIFVPIGIKYVPKVFIIIFPFLLGNLLWLSNNNPHFIGMLYFLRIFSFIIFTLVVKDLVVIKKKYIEIIPKILIFESFVVGVLGFIQYLYLPNFKSFVEWGWDDHLYRLIGPFFDPGFTGILLSLGFILSFFVWIKNKNKNYLLISLFLMLSLALTYSRASMLSLVLSIFLIVFFTKQIKYLIFILLFGLIVFILPRPASEGAELERVASIFSRIENYSETFEIFKKNPIFGVGVNNLCDARIKYFENNIQSSHSCSGSDSSILFIFSTTGLVGFFVLLKILIDEFKTINLTKTNDQIIVITAVAIFIHSQFTNSLFYPWVLGWLCLVLVSLSLSQKTVKIT